MNIEYRILKDIRVKYFQMIKILRKRGMEFKW